MISHGDSLAERAAIDEGQLRTLFSVAVLKRSIQFEDIQRLFFLVTNH